MLPNISAVTQYLVVRQYKNTIGCVYSTQIVVVYRKSVGNSLSFPCFEERKTTNLCIRCTTREHRKSVGNSMSFPCFEERNDK